MIENLLKNLNYCKPSYKINFIKIPVNFYKFDETGVKKFNEVYSEVLEHKDDYYKIVRAPAGGISYKNNNLRLPAYDVIKDNAAIELTLLTGWGFTRIRLANVFTKESETEITGSYAFCMFKNALKEDGINLDDYTIDNGFEVKNTIESYIVDFASPAVFTDISYNHVYHVDFHNSFASGLAITHPEFYKTIDRLHRERILLKQLKEIKPLTDAELKRNEIIKAIFTHSIGYMQSKYIKARWAHLSKDAIANNNTRLVNLATEIHKAGYKPLCFNTDGIWYADTQNIGPYHDNNEGNNLGQWHTDHSDCIIRFKSEGSYEFIENGIYYPVVRGRTKYDSIKPRSDWQWGDIYNNMSEVINYEFDEEIGIYEVRF